MKKIIKLNKEKLVGYKRKPKRDQAFLEIFRIKKVLFNKILIIMKLYRLMIPIKLVMIPFQIQFKDYILNLLVNLLLIIIKHKVM